MRPFLKIATGVLGDPSPSLAKGRLGRSRGVITKIERFDLPCRVGKVLVHHVDRKVRDDGSYGLAAIPAGDGHVDVTAGGAFVSIEADLTLAALDPEDPTPCLPIYSADGLETYGGRDAFGIAIDEPEIAYPVNEVAIAGAFTGPGTILGTLAGKAAFFDPEHVCPIVDTFVAKAPKRQVHPVLDTDGVAPGGQAG